MSESRLNQAADLIIEHGWWAGSKDTEPVDFRQCAITALITAWRSNYSEYGYDDDKQRLKTIIHATDITLWNDNSDKETVVRTMREASKLL